MAALKERKARAETKVSRAEKAVDSARRELADILAAERVVAEITGEPSENRAESVAGAGVSERDIAIAKMIPTDKAAAISPADLHALYVQEHDDLIGLEAFRTAVWRLLKKRIVGQERTWSVKSQNSRYWREAVLTDDGPDYSSVESDDEEEEL